MEIICMFRTIYNELKLYTYVIAYIYMLYLYKMEGAYTNSLEYKLNEVSMISFSV